jgi:hypothetical protein
MGTARRYAMQDFVFVSIGLVFYRVVERTIIHPLAVCWTNNYVPSSPEYQMGVGLSLQKIRLLLDTINVSFSGPWYLIFFEAGIFVFLGLIALFLIMNYQKLAKQWQLNSEKCIWLVFIILFMNAPTLLAEGDQELLGFRVLFPTAMLAGCLLVFGFMIIGRENKYKWVSLLLVFVMVVFSGIVDVGYLKKVVNSYSRELSLVRQGLKACDVEKTRYYFLVRLPKGENLSGYRLPFEFSFMITGPQHFYPFVREYVLNKHGNRFVKVRVITEQQALEIGSRADVCFIRVHQ